MPELYVIVAENDVPDKDFGIDPDGEIIFERYTSRATLKLAKEDAMKLGRRYGRCRIARLVFLEEE